MELVIQKAYLVFPVSRNAAKKRLMLFRNGECCYDLELRLDYVTPENDVYVDVRRFHGEALDISVSPGMELSVKQKDNSPNCRFRERLRPKYHFTAPYGWINDPNGLVFANGLYHLFYQWNPVGTEWGNMHWGHAVSANLVDWEYRPCALFPDKHGTMFSGSAVIDEKNLLGARGESGRNAMLLYYTAAGGQSEASRGQPYTQGVAVSADGGLSFIKLPGNPIISHIEGNNRDPKVVYSEKHGFYVMSLYLDGDRYLILRSDNLIDWERLSEISLPGDSECPAFFPMPYEKGEKWVLMGASDRYIVGEFDGKKFTPDHEGSLIFNYSNNATYAAQRFEGLSFGEVIRVAWMKSNLSSFGQPFNGAMTVPQRLTLVKGEGGARLSVSPCREIERLRGRKVKEKLVTADFSSRLHSVASDITLAIDPREASFATVSVFGYKLSLDLKEMTISASDLKAPLELADGKINIRLLFDTCGAEVYLSDGLSYLAMTDVPDMNLPLFLFSSDSPCELKYEAYKLRDSRKSDNRDKKIDIR